MSRTMAVALLVMVASSTFAQKPIYPGDPLFVPDEVKPGVAMIEAQFEGGTQTGAGLLFGRKAGRLYILTANHVVRKGVRSASAVKVYLSWIPGEGFDGRLSESSDSQLDVAVLILDARVPAPPNGWRSLPDVFPWGTKVERGDAVYAMGYPDGRKWFVRPVPDTVDSVSADSIEFDAAYLAPGYSGGALFDEVGTLIGMIRKDKPPTGEAISLERLATRLEKWGYTPGFPGG